MRTMSSEEQLERWVAGDSVHNGNPGDNDSECCPDFSCCKPELKWSQDLRIRFRDGDDNTRIAMCGMALTALLESMGRSKDVYVAGENHD